jgi:hypothetical protein
MADQENRGNQNDTGSTSGRRNPADNLTHQDRVRGGERSAQMQTRDQRGQFAGRKKGESENRSSFNNQGQRQG